MCVLVTTTGWPGSNGYPWDYNSGNGDDPANREVRGVLKVSRLPH